MEIFEKEDLPFMCGRQKRMKTLIGRASINYLLEKAGRIDRVQKFACVQCNK